MMKKLFENEAFQYCSLLVIIFALGWAVIFSINKAVNIAKIAKNNEKVHWSDNVEPVHNYKDEVVSNIRIGYRKNGDVVWREEFVKTPFDHSIILSPKQSTTVELGSNMHFQ